MIDTWHDPETLSEEAVTLHLIMGDFGVLVRVEESGTSEQNIHPSIRYVAKMKFHVEELVISADSNVHQVLLEN